MARLVGIGAASWKRLELENRAPKGEVLAQLVEMGFDVNWLLSGRGEMRPAQTGHAAEAATELDADLYGRVLEQVSAVYKECGYGASLRQIGEKAAEIAADLAGPDLATPEAKAAAAKAAAAMLRRQLRDAIQNPNSPGASQQKA